MCEPFGERRVKSEEESVRERLERERIVGVVVRRVVLDGVDVGVRVEVEGGEAGVQGTEAGRPRLSSERGRVAMSLSRSRDVGGSDSGKSSSRIERFAPSPSLDDVEAWNCRGVVGRKFNPLELELKPEFPSFFDASSSR